MFYDTFWALILGFAVSGAIQAYVPRVSALNSLGDHKPKTVFKSAMLGAISSSCSYAASAIAKSLVDKGSDFTTAIIFMFASTNLVFELGIVMWTLLGWQFALAELIGGAFMIALLAILVPRLKIPRKLKLLKMAEESPDSTSATAQDAANFMLGDLRMIKTELILGFLVAGQISALIPTSWWGHLFIKGHGVVSGLENVAISPLISVVSFVCSVGNIPLAATLWNSGISFGATISFIFADLITIPLLLIYAKYFGKKLTIKLFLLFWFVMSSSGYLTQGIFALFKISPHRLGLTPRASHFANDATSWLNLVALAIFAVVIWLHYSSSGKSSGRFAIDPICGMSVEKASAASQYNDGKETYYFCAPGCLEKFKNSVSR